MSIAYTLGCGTFYFASFCSTWIINFCHARSFSKVIVMEMRACCKLLMIQSGLICHWHEFLSILMAI